MIGSCGSGAGHSSHRRHLFPIGQLQRSDAWCRHTRWSGLQGQVSADRKQVVLHFWHCRSSSGTSSNTSCSDDSTPCRHGRETTGGHPTWSYGNIRFTSAPSPSNHPSRILPSGFGFSLPFSGNKISCVMGRHVAQEVELTAPDELAVALHG